MNKHVSPARANNTPSTGNGAPYANMPANNNGTFKAKIGSGKDSKFGHGTSPATSAAKTGTVNNVGAKMNTTNYVNTGNKVQLGNTKHGVGNVPAYLRNPSNPK